MRHLPDLKFYSQGDILEILQKAKAIKADIDGFRNALTGQTLAMLFQKTSTRTRISFEAGMTELGGHAIYIDWRSSNFVLTDIAYETAYVSRNVACIMARLLHNTDVQRMVASSLVPVINGCCEKFHPCQALTDLFTIMETWEGPLEEAHLVYLGVQNNVANSLTLICDKLGVRLTLVTPETRPDARDDDVEAVIHTSSFVSRSEDPREAVRDANYIYTDTWVDMELFDDPARQEEKANRLKKMMPYQVNAALVAGVSCKIMHDMPIHAGYEMTDEIVYDPRSVIFQQAENRMHTQKGLLWWILRNEES